MQFSSILVAAATFTLAQAAQITNTPGDFVGVASGKALDITWSNATGPVTLLLKNGISTNLQPVLTIASGLSGATGSFSWTPSASLPSDTYAIEIDDSTGPNYSVQFAVAGAASVSSSSASSTSTSSGSSSSSASSASTTSSGSSTSTGSSSSSSQTGSSTSSSSTGSSSSSASKTSSATTTSKTGSTSTTASSTSATTSSISSASNLSSPLALILLAIAAFVTLN